jgi:hypothetical protein
MGFVVHGSAMLTSPARVSDVSGRPPAPIIAIHVLAFIGVAFWASTIISAIISASSDVWWVILIGVILGGAHLAISRLTTLHSSTAIYFMWFVFVADSLLAIFVQYQAVILVIFTIVLLGLTRFPSSKLWYSTSQ